jgi:hypothetical protein
MHLTLVSTLLLLMQPVADPTYFAYNSPQCVAHRLFRQGNILPLIVRTTHPPCPWTSDEASLVEVGRQYSEYSWWNFARTNNLELAAAKIDGTMLMPGEVFSYNEIVGERTEDSGFKEAKVIGISGYIDGIGGGVCQPASNAYAAAFHAGLGVEERWTHRFRVKYMPPGLDATVDFGKKDLKVRNNTPFPVVFHMSKIGKGGLLTQVWAPIRTFRVTYKYDVVSQTPSDTVQFKLLEEPIKDVVEYYGRPGFELKKTVKRKNLLTRKFERLRLRNDVYFPSPWTLNVSTYPTGSRVLTGLRAAQINKLLSKTKYTIDSAKFWDLEKFEGEFIPRSYVSGKDRRSALRFSNIKKYIDLASFAVPGKL